MSEKGREEIVVFLVILLPVVGRHRLDLHSSPSSRNSAMSCGAFPQDAAGRASRLHQRRCQLHCPVSVVLRGEHLLEDAQGLGQRGCRQRPNTLDQPLMVDRTQLVQDEVPVLS